MVYLGTPATNAFFTQYVTLYIHSVGGAEITFCGGTLADPMTVATAAHCLLPDFPIDGIVVVSADETRAVVAQDYIVNPAYNPTVDDQWQYDTGVVRLISPLRINSMDFRPDLVGDWDSLPDGAPLSIVGRGLVCGSGGLECQSRTLMKGTVGKVVRQRCLGKSEWQWPLSVLGQGTICAGGASPWQTPHACPGDSGGPLFGASGVVFGAVSAGDALVSPCGNTLRPTLFSSFAFNSHFLSQFLVTNFTANYTSVANAAAKPSSARQRGSKRTVGLSMAVTMIIYAVLGRPFY